MTNVNKRPLPKSQAELLQVQFHRLIGSLNERQSSVFFGQLLGNEERVMLMKRLGTIIMLSEGHSRYRVAKSLAISPATADTIANRLKRGDYDQLLNTIGSSTQSYKHFKETLLSLIGTALYLSSNQAPRDLVRKSLRRK
jgi:uncharacterized protein YerC